MIAPIRVSPSVWLDTFYLRTSRYWCGRYLDLDGNQLGSSWNASTRDYLLLFRPPEPTGSHSEECGD
jgi:hypothetical protein